MSKIPTAEEILIKESILLKTIEESGNFPLNLTRDTHIGTAKDIKEAMIEFAKLHVEAALKEANIKSMLRVIPSNQNTYFKEEILVSNIEDNTQNIWIQIEDSSILNAYPLTNIK